jgi:hypothetical protein
LKDVVSKSNNYKPFVSVGRVFCGVPQKRVVLALAGFSAFLHEARMRVPKLV